VTFGRLAYLARGRAGDLEGHLLNDVWGSLTVSESALTRSVTELRHALGDDATIAPDERRLWVSATRSESLDLMVVDPPSSSRRR
jgi:hypothetical protein